MPIRWRVDSEYGRLRDVLLCRPDHYEFLPLTHQARVAIAAGRKPDRAAIEAQHAELTSALSEAGVALHFLEPVASAKFQVFTRDSSTVTPWGPVFSPFASEWRKGEYAPVHRFYGGDGFFKLADAGNVEGGDVHIIKPGVLLVGCSGLRTNRRGAEQYAGWFAAEGWDTRIFEFPELFVHLDLAFCMAAEGLAVACVDVLDDGLVGWLNGHGIRLLPISYREMMALGGNLLALGDGRVVSPRHNTRVNDMLRAEGLTVFDPELWAFTGLGGGVHCMTMALARDPVRGRFKGGQDGCDMDRRFRIRRAA